MLINKVWMPRIMQHFHPVVSSKLWFLYY